MSGRWVFLLNLTTETQLNSHSIKYNEGFDLQQIIKEILYLYIYITIYI